MSQQPWWIKSILISLLCLFLSYSVLIAWGKVDRSREWSQNIGWTDKPSPVLSQEVMIGQPWSRPDRPVSFIAPMVATYLHKYSDGVLIFKILSGLNQPGSWNEIESRLVWETEIGLAGISDNAWSEFQVNPYRLEGSRGFFLLFQLKGGTESIPGPVSLWLRNGETGGISDNPALVLENRKGEISSGPLSGPLSLRSGYQRATGWAQLGLRLPWSKWWPWVALIGVVVLSLFFYWCAAKPNRLLSAVLIITWISLLATVTIIVFGLDRGIDFTDEGIYLITYANPQDDVHTPWHYQRLVNLVLSPFPSGVLTYRWATLISTIIAAVFFFWPLKRLSNSKWPLNHWWTSVPFLCLGGLLCFSFGPPTLSYNHVSNFFMVISIGFTVLGLSAQDRSSSTEKARSIWLGAAGLAAALGFFAKFTTSLGLIFVLATLIVLIGPKGRRLSRTLWLLGGYLSGFLLYFTICIDFSTWWSQFRLWIVVYVLGTGMEANPYYTPTNIFEIYWRYLSLQAPLALWGMAGWVLSYALGVSSRKIEKPGVSGGVTILIGLGLGFTGYGLTKTGELWNGGTPESYFAFLWLFGLIAFYGLGLAGRSGIASWFDRDHIKKTMILALLLAAPLLAVVGSGNVPMIQLLQHLIPWFGLFLYLLALINNRFNAATFAGLLIFAIVLIIPLQLWTSYILHPFRLPHSRLEQTERVTTKTTDRLNGILVSPARKELLEGIDRILDQETDYREGDILLVNGSRPGIPWVFKGRYPGNPIDPQTWSMALENKGLDKSERTFLLYPECNGPAVSGICLKTVEVLKRVGLSFPDGFRLAGRYKRWIVYAPIKTKD